MLAMLVAHLPLSRAAGATTQPASTTQPARITRTEAIAAMHTLPAPIKRESGPTAVDSSTLTGKVMAGYQGWFTAEGDGSGTAWQHYRKGGSFGPGHVCIDLWPHVTDLTPAERYATPFRTADGSAAEVFSSHNRRTVLRHLQWMRDYGIDGAFVQRFAVATGDGVSFHHCNTVLDSVREGANRYGRAYAVMYDLSGLRAGHMKDVMEDWKLLHDRMGIGRDVNDKAYLHHLGKPVVAVWGVGFDDKRAYTLDECAALVSFLKDDPTYGGNAVMLGVPTGWRTLDRDSIPDPALHATICKADIVSPWTIGRYNTPERAAAHAQQVIEPDLKWCDEQKLAYLPVVFPGFSWHNLKPESRSDSIPRLKGQFLWRQCVEAKKAGARMIYVAMFDEMDEGTAIFKCTNNPPVGESTFVTHPDVPNDHYLWLTGAAAKMLRGELPATDEMPAR